MSSKPAATGKEACTTTWSSDNVTNDRPSSIERGRAQGLVEYGLIIALVAVLAIATLIVYGPAVRGLLSKLGGSV